MWQNRIYALIIRRILGPYLTSKSKRNLQETLDISLRQGRVTLNSIELDGKVLTDNFIKQKKTEEVKNNEYNTSNHNDGDNDDPMVIAKKQQSKQSTNPYEISIKTVAIDELNISLFLVYDDVENESGTDDTYNDGGATTSSSDIMGAKLVAKVELNGVHVQLQLEPSSSISTSSKYDSDRKDGTIGSFDTKRPQQEKESAGSGFIQSYIQAALDSLKLTLDVQNLTIEIMSTSSSSAKTKSPPMPLSSPFTQTNTSLNSWIAIHLNSLSYKDSSLPPPPPSATISRDSQGGDDDDDNDTHHTGSTNAIKSKVILGKEICFHQLWIEIGTNRGIGGENICPPAEILRYDGYATIIATIMKHVSSKASRNKEESMERQLEIALDDLLSIQINPTTLMAIRNVFIIENKMGKSDDDSSYESVAHISSLKYHTRSDDSDPRQCIRSSCYVDDTDFTDEDEQDIGLLAHILQQQQIESSSYMSTPHNNSMDVTTESYDSSKQNSSLDVEGFFHTNQEGYSHYCKLASSLQIENREDDLDNYIPTVEGSSDSAKNESMTTAISFYLKEILLKIQLNRLQEDKNGYDNQIYDIVASENHDSGSIVSSIIEVNAVMTQSSISEQTDLSLDVNHFSVYYQKDVPKPQRCNLYQFVQNLESRKNSSLEPSSEDVVISVKYSSWRQGDTKETDMNLTLKPILITLRQNIILLLIDSYRDFVASGHKGDETKLSSNASDSASISEKEMKKIRVECSLISVEVPMELGIIWDNDVSKSLENLFRRSGYMFDSHNPILSPTMAFTATDIDINMFKSNTESAEGNVEVQLVLEKSMLSLLAVLDKSGERNQCLKFDFLTVDSETQIDPDAKVKIQYSYLSSLGSTSDSFKKQRARKFFPSAVPLSLVKSSQQFDEDDDQNTSNKNCLSTSKRSIRGVDPQSRMLKESSLCEKNVLIQIPNIAIDLNIGEKDALLHLIMLTAFQNNDLSNNDPNVKEENRALNKKSNLIGISFRCNQLLLSLHQNFNPVKEEKAVNYLHLIAFDGFNIYCLKNTYGLRHLRFLAEDITFYEIHSRKIHDSCSQLFRVEDMCDMLRKRRFDRSDVIQSNAVFFRTKLSHPLSPKTPALLIDLIMTRQEYDLDDIESSLHVSLYDFTFRHDIDSCWVDRLKTFCEMQSDPRNMDKVISGKHDETSKVTNIFCTISDCNFDYSSPIYFNKSSRTIVRVGEVRITSTLISPPGPMQTCKLSIGDVSVHLSNKCGGYEEENARLTCSNLIIDPEVVLLKKKSVLSHSYDDALFQLGFVAIASLDYLEGIISAQTRNKLEQTIDFPSDRPSEADSTLTLSVGKLSVFACKDSFEHFIGTINELILKLTMPSKEVLDAMRKDFFGNDIKEEIKLTRAKQQIVTPATGFLFGKDPLSLDEVIKDGLFSGDDMNGSISKEFTGTEEETLRFLQVNEELPESASGHEVIHDFYEYDSNQSPNQHSSSSLDEELTDCWTAIDHPWSDDPCIPDGEEQSSRWYAWDDNNTKQEDTLPQLKPPSGTVIVEGKIPTGRQPRIFNRHIPLSATTDPLADGDMGASSFAGTKQINVKMRIVVTEMNFLCRLFDGYDWPTIIVSKPKDSNTKSKLLGDLMESDDSPSLFSDQKDIAQVTEIKHMKPRISERYFQFSFAGLKLRLDSFHQSEDHFLSSCLEMKLNDMNVIETVSSDKLVKLLGEWRNEDDHPRDSNDGLLMMKMVSLIPEIKFAVDGKLMGNECHVVLEFLPIRFFIHQIALRFIRQFFQSDVQEISTEDCMDENDIDGPPDIFFPTFNVKPFDIKVDYKPLEVDRTALKDGSYIQLLNLLPLEDMILRLNGVELRNLTGWGPIISELACKWLQDVSSTQMHKFLTRTTPLHPLANVGDGMKNFVLIPLREYRQRGNVKKALRKSTSKLVGVVAYETLSVSAKLTGYAAKKLNKGKKKLLSSSSSSFSSADKSSSSLMPPSLLSSSSNTTLVLGRTSTRSKPISAIPRNMGDVSDRAIESLSRGLKEANAKIIIIPYREYQKTGTTGAMKKVVRGIPVAVCAPLSGAVEALSHGLYGASNSLRPDLFEEREASKRFHDEDL